MSERRIVALQIRGRELRIRSDDSEEALERIARRVDDTMARVEARTGAIDSYDVAMLTALNLAREVVAREVRDGGGNESAAAAPVPEVHTAGRGRAEPDESRLRALIELAEAAAATERA